MLLFSCWQLLKAYCEFYLCDGFNVVSLIKDETLINVLPVFFFNNVGTVNTDLFILEIVSTVIIVSS